MLYIWFKKDALFWRHFYVCCCISGEFLVFKIYDATASVTVDAQVHFYYDLLNHNKWDQETSRLARISQKKNFENDFLKIEDWLLALDLFLKAKT